MSEKRRLKFSIEIEDLIFVALGSVPGAQIRWLLGYLHFDQLITYLNLFGSFCLGCLIGLNPDRRFILLIGVGFCGSLTSFSFWILDLTKLLFIEGVMIAIVSMLFILGLGLFFGMMGYLIGKWIKFNL